MSTLVTPAAYAAESREAHAILGTEKNCILANYLKLQLRSQNLTGLSHQATTSNNGKQYLPYRKGSATRG